MASATVGGMTTPGHAGAQPLRWTASGRSALPLAAGTAASVAGVVRLPGALHHAFWQDEVASARIVVEQSPVRMLHDVVASESTPPLWYALGWLAHRAGASPVEIRLLSAAAGAALAAAVVVYARRHVPTWAAGLAGLAAALGYQFVLHGEELRAYALYALLSVLLALAAERVVDEPTRPRAAALAAVVAAGSLTHYFFVLLVAGVGVWALHSPARRLLLGSVAAGLVPVGLWTPMLLRQWKHDGFSFIGAFDAHDVVLTYWRLFARAQPSMPVLHELAPLAVAVLVVAGAVLLARASAAGRLCASLAVLPVLVAGLAWLAGVDVFDVRNLIGVGPFAAVAAAGAMTRFPARVAAPAACLCAALLVAGFVQAERVPPVAYDRIAADLAAEGWRPGDPILVYGNVYALRTPLEWYLPGRPRLVIRDRPCPCARVFVVASGGRARRRIARAAIELRHERRVVVARVGVAGRWPGAVSLASRSRTQPS